MEAVSEFHLYSIEQSKINRTQIPFSGEFKIEGKILLKIVLILKISAFT